MIKINKLKILTLLILSGIIATPSDIVKAEKLYNVSEYELIQLLEKHKNENVTLEDGLVLTLGEILDLEVNEGWTVYNDEVLEIVDGELIPKSVGSTFITQESGNDVYIVEVYITEDEISLFSNARSVETKVVDRDYYKVFIDPGHGGADPGAVRNGFYEDEINLQISKKIEQLLLNRGVEVKLSRNDDVYLSLVERTNMANNYESDIFVSIHQNSAEAVAANGIETFYYASRQDSKLLATDVQENLIQNTNANNRGVKTADFSVIRTASMPSSLVECGFISNITEGQKLNSDAYQNVIAKSIADGIMEYLKDNVQLNINEPESKPEEPVAPSTPSESIKNGVVSVSGSLNVRSGAGTNYSVLGSLSNGAKVEIVSTSGSWHKIKYGSGYGYVHGDYVTVTSSSNTPTTNTPTTSTPESTTTKTGTVNSTTGLNVRSGAGTSYSTLGLLQYNSKVEIVSTSGSWHKIKYGSGYGYVHGDYVTVTSSSNTPTTNTPTTSTPESTTTKTGTVNSTTGLNVRSGAGTSYSTLGLLQYNSKVEIVSTSGSWHKIKYGSGYGYVHGDYVTITSSSNTPTTSTPESTTTKTGSVNSSAGLNVRSGAGTTYSILGVLANNTSVEIVSESNGWYKIKYKTSYGFVSQDYITLNNRIAAESSSVIKEGVAVTVALKVREESDYDSTVIGTIAMGDKVAVIEDNGYWSKINYKDNVGYIVNDYVDYNLGNVI